MSSSAMSMVSCDLQETSTHSMNAARLSRGPSSDNCSLVAALSPALYNPKSEKVGTVWKTQIKKESSDF